MPYLPPNDAGNLFVSGSAPEPPKNKIVPVAGNRFVSGSAPEPLENKIVPVAKNGIGFGPKGMPTPAPSVLDSFMSFGNAMRDNPVAASVRDSLKNSVERSTATYALDQIVKGVTGLRMAGAVSPAAVGLMHSREAGRGSDIIRNAVTGEVLNPVVPRMNIVNRGAPAGMPKPEGEP